VDDKTAVSVMNLVENLEDLDDVTNVYSNLEISEALLQSLEE
jgi:transcriptional/translational regulatory protein YebC/TACO1